MEGDSRRFIRSALELPVTLSFNEALTVRGSIRNLSIAGMFVQTGQSAPEGAVCESIFETEPMKRVGIQCSVVHRSGAGLGLEITGIENGSFDYLRELIIQQSDDPQACEDEILANMGRLPALY